MIRVTVILRRSAEVAPDLSWALSDDAFREGVKPRVGNGSFRDRMDLHALRMGPHKVAARLEKRRGYRLAVYEVSR